MIPPDWNLALQRFVSGEMTEADERAFLAACERSPNRWRDVALEMVEWRTFRRLLAEDTVPVLSRPRATPAPLRRPWPVLRALAATLLFVAGAACGWLIPAAVRPPSNPVVTAPIALQPRDEEAGPPSEGMSVVLTFDPSNDEEADPVPLPVFRPEDVPYLSEHPLARLDEAAAPWHDSLRQAGVEIEAVQTWYVVQTDADRVVLIPHYTAQLRPVSD